MGRRKGWFSALRSAIFGSRNKTSDGSCQKGSRGIRGFGNSRSLIPGSVEQSGIEEIFGEADKLSIWPPKSYEKNRRKDSLLESLDESAFSTQGVYAPSSTCSPVKTAASFDGTDPSSRTRFICATNIQAAFRGYRVRKNTRSMRAVMRLQRVVRGQNVGVQAASAMKQMQTLIRIQLQIYSMRVRKQKGHRPPSHNDKEVESCSKLGRWSLRRLGDWDDSLLSKEEKELRSWRKKEATVKRERAIAYSQSHKANQACIRGHQKLKSNGYPKWWNWLESHLPSSAATITRNVSSSFPKNCPQNESLISRKTPNQDTSQHRRSTIGSARNNPSLRDDESFSSCPVSLTPSYMIHTASSRAKARENGHNEEADMEKNRFSFRETQNRRPEKLLHRKSVGDMSFDSFLSLPMTKATTPSYQ